MASIPSLRPLVMKTLRDLHAYRSRSRSTKSAKEPLEGPPATRSDVPVAGPSSQYDHQYNAKGSAGGAKEPGWTPLGSDGGGGDNVYLRDLGRN